VSLLEGVPNISSRTAILCSQARILWFLLLLVPSAHPADIFLPTESAAPGSSVYLSVAFVSRSALVSAIQFDLNYDGSAMSLIALAGESTRTSGKLLYQADLGSNSKRFLIAGLSQSAIPDGFLIGLFGNLNPSASKGTYALKLSNVVASDGDGKAIPVTAVEGSIGIQGTIEQSVRLHPAGVLNGGSLVSGAVSPGQVITLIGSGIGPEPAETPGSTPSTRSLGGTSVLFDESPAPMLYAGPSQINAVVPFAVNGTSTQLRIIRDGQTLSSLELPVVLAAPAIFTVDASGVGPGAILNQNLTINSVTNPADRGSVVSIFATGAGQTNPPSVDGQINEDPFPKPMLPVSVQIGGWESDVLFVGAAPNLISGIVQVNSRIPASVVAGPAVPVILKVGTAASPQGVTLAVR
jgi:uncharacterized protein (TIGR03437 family)